MSHFHQRSEKNCLNCGTMVSGKYCQHCGQENIEPHQSFWQLIKHYFEDLTHFDGKFFKTTALLATRPGFLPSEYIKGKRASYLNPIRMYIFTSALFFFVFFALGPSKESFKINTSPSNGNYAASVEMDSVEFNQFTRGINRALGKGDVPMTREEYKNYADTTSRLVGQFGKTQYHSKEEYDSAVALGKEKKVGFWETKMRYRAIELGQKYGKNYDGLFTRLQDKFLHSLPQLIFISLPLSGIFLLLLYYKKKQFYYADHFIFSLFLYILFFLVLLVSLLLKKLDASSGVSIFSWLSTGLWLWFWIYLLFGLKRFYQQGWLKTVVKYILFLALLGIMQVILFVTAFILFMFFFV